MAKKQTAILLMYLLIFQNEFKNGIKKAVKINSQSVKTLKFMPYKYSLYCFREINIIV